MTCNLRDYLMLRILWRTDIRVSELLSTRPQDLEPHTQIINITKAKGSKQRRAMLDPETLDLLSECILIHNILEYQPVFTLSSVQVWNIVKKYGRMINVDTHQHTSR
jgi:integrase